MTETSPVLGLPYIAPSQAQKHVTHNEAIQTLDLVVQLVVEDFGIETPPAVPQSGNAYALGANPDGAWAGHAHEIAIWRFSGWDFAVPLEGWRAYGRVSGNLRVWDGTEWALLPVETDNLDGLGIGTTSDAQNRLSVQSPSTLLSHEGGGHQLKVNKSSSTETASLLFQSDWSGHAEMGLSGSNDFSIKVSADGSTWLTSLEVDGLTGRITGEAVQEDAEDTAEGRLLTVGAFGLGNRAVILGGGDDYDDVSVCSFIGDWSVGANPANGPDNDALFTGVHMCNGANQSAQMVFQLNGQKRVYYRTENNVWSDWSYLFDSDNVIGTVSESGGTPTGAIIERGSNANGEYVRFADGTQICTNANTAITTASAAFVGSVTKLDGDKCWIGTWY